MDKAIAGVIHGGQFIGGEEVDKFAVEFANIADTPYCIPCANGTDALEIALTSLGIGKKDEVIIPAFSFVATLEAVCNVGATPVFSDIDPDRLTMDAGSVKSNITDRTKAIIPVHLYGQMADMEPLLELSRKHHFFVVEDAAQAHKAEYKGFLAGSMGHFGTFSFYPGKNLGAYGDAGAITTNDEKLYNTAFKIANHGRTSKYDHEIVGRNSRMDSLQAAILNIKLKHLEDWIKARREIVAGYDASLNQIDSLRLPKSFPESQSVYHLYVIQVDKGIRDILRSYLTSVGIETGVHYPIALSKLKVTTGQLNIKADCPESEKASGEVISLPMYPELSSSQQDYICNHIKKFFSSSFSYSGTSLIKAGKQQHRKKKA